MPRTFYTERDIEELAGRGIKEIEVNDDVYLTDLALEKMEKLGIRARPAAASAAPATSLDIRDKDQVVDRVKSGVLARLGPGVDAAVVDAIVRRVVAQL